MCSNDQDTIGKVARCKHGLIGVIKEIRHYPGIKVYLGESLFCVGKHWQSVQPEILANSVAEYRRLEQRIEDAYSDE